MLTMVDNIVLAVLVWYLHNQHQRGQEHHRCLMTLEYRNCMEKHAVLADFDLVCCMLMRYNVYSVQAIITLCVILYAN